MLFAKFKMMELPNGKYLLLEHYLDGWKYAYYVEFYSSPTSANMHNFKWLEPKYHDDRGSNTMKEAIVLWCKTKNLITDRKEAKKNAPKPKVVYKWLSEEAMLADMDTLDND